MNTENLQGDLTASKRITNLIEETSDWRGDLIAHLRRSILESSPDIQEEWKWDSPVWSYKGLVCAAGVYKDHVKLNFFKGASLKDPNHIFNAGLDAKTTRAIDFYLGDAVDGSAIQELVRAAVALNDSAKKKK